MEHRKRVASATLLLERGKRMLVAGTSHLLRQTELQGKPQPGLPDEVNEWRERNFEHLSRGLEKISIVGYYDIPAFLGSLYIARIEEDGSRTDFGLASLRVVTTVGANFIVDAFQNTAEVDTMRFHDWGTGTNAENVSDTGLQAQYGGARGTGTQGEGASANVYRTVGTSAVLGATLNITEHGIFSASSGGTLLDRSVFAAVNVPSGQSVQTTYDFTVSPGS